MKTFINKRLFAGAIFAVCFGIATIITHAQSSGNNSISLKADSSTGFFVLTIKASSPTNVKIPPFQGNDPGAECAKYGGTWDGKTCQMSSSGAAPTSGQTQPPPQASPTSDQVPQEYCSGFATVPSCSYVGSSDSQNYKYCKQCFPDK